MSKAISAKQYRLLSMPYAQCRVYIKRFENGGVSVEFISYETSVLYVTYNPYVGAALYCSGLYSTTTSRHINRFTSELFGYSKYHECKSAFFDSARLATPGWYYVCNVEPERLFKMCERYESEARGYDGGIKL